MESSQDEPALVCPICSKPIRAGIGTARVGLVVAHLRCLARQNGFRALELEDRAAGLVSRAQQAVRESKRLLAEAAPFALAGRITAFDAATRRLTVGVEEVLLAAGIPLEGLAPGRSVTVAGHGVGKERTATRLILRSARG